MKATMRANVLSTLTLFCSAALGLFTAAPPVWAQPVPAAERIPVDIRRTTFVVQDIDKSPALHRDALGLTLICDQLIGGDLDTRWATIERTPHIKIDTPPTRAEYPSPGGGVIPVMFSAVWGPDGNYIELNTLLGAAAGTAAPKSWRFGGRRQVLK